MPSLLTRQVFRRLLASEPIVHRGCLRRPAYSTIPARGDSCRRASTCRSFPAVRPAQRRTFFNLNMFRKPKREAREADMDPGIDMMMHLVKMQRMRTRLPHPADVAKALDDFVLHKRRSAGVAVEDTQAQLALQSIRYCLESQAAQEQAADGSEATVLLPASFFQLVAIVLKSDFFEHYSIAHVELAKVMYENLAHGNRIQYRHALQAYCRVLSYSGSPDQARELLLQQENTGPTHAASSGNVVNDEFDMDESTAAVEDTHSNTSKADLHSCWRCVLKGFTLKRNEVELERTLAMMTERGFGIDLNVTGIFLQYYISQGNASVIRKWWDQWKLFPQKTRGPQSARSGIILGQLLEWCLNSGQLEFGQQAVRYMTSKNPTKLYWDVIFVWAAGTGKGVEEIGRMMDVMERSNQNISDQKSWRTPDIATINALVAFSISKDDPYMAERFIALGKDRGIEQNARTYVLQMEYRLGVNDVDGALTAYKNLQAMDLSENEDIPAVNKLVVALCSSKRHDFETIMNVAADLSDRRARFEPLTVATLSMLHLGRDEVHDVIDLLNTHAFHYSSTGRATIRNALVSHITDPATPTSRAWDAYTIIRSIFDELARDARTELMTSFFKRERPDMAVHIFNHMRAHSRADTIPTVDTYIAAFMGTARLRDLESLEVVHNQLKLDYNVDMNTLFRNALVIAYTACERPRKALGFWDEIVASREGPSYNSIHIALRACEKSPFGDVKAKEIWDKLRKMKVDLDSTMWASYVAALAGNGDVRQAVRAVEEAEKKGELEVDAFVLGSLFAGAPGMTKQGEVEAWGKQRYERVWKELEGMGCVEEEDGTRVFGIDRSVTP
ncbi:hypothetical protein LTR08_000874 [Meristemomyces frigidus]|nr:hypothetical protein LTR08_000874 [Meristemomyces frigidus]